VLGEGTALWVAPELTDPVGPLDIGEHHDVEELGAGNRAEGVKAGSESALKLVRSHAGDYAEVPRPIVGQQS
jgi:hypothetical protein